MEGKGECPNDDYLIMTSFFSLVQRYTIFYIINSNVKAGSLYTDIKDDRYFVFNGRTLV